VAPAPISQRRTPILSERLCAVGLVTRTDREDDAVRVGCEVFDGAWGWG